MANEIKVTTATLRQKAGELRQLNGKLKTEIGELQTEESALNGMWEGESHDAFHKAFSDDIVQMNNFYNAIDQYAKALDQIIQEYERAEKTNLSTAQTRKY